MNRWIATRWQAWTELQRRTWRWPERAVGGALVPAAVHLRPIAEQSGAWMRLRPRLVSPEPVASWQAHGLHYFRYELRPDARGRRPNALFIVHEAGEAPASAVVVTPGLGGEPTETVDLLRAAPMRAVQGGGR